MVSGDRCCEGENQDKFAAGGANHQPSIVSSAPLPPPPPRQDEPTVVGFEVPKSPDASYNNVYPWNEDEARDPPVLPPHLQHTLLSYPPNSGDTSANLPLPQNVILNHLYIENREPPRSVVALGFTHRFRSKYVTVVLYQPVQRRGCS
ncbi:SNF1-related protein kinase regulatory subunit beta-3-like [Rutidosis leptorrhynchoides]|uniref:SNF1-related protein kinase regulatory subunit beta-3-like n=1 Tax=Rutidosis leptorrhynchoides TaxID=125765 RepID=UPI003A99FCB3